MSHRVEKRVNSGRLGTFPEPVRDEIGSAIRYWYSLGYSDRVVALKVGVCDRTVLRHRSRQGLPANVGGSDGGHQF